LSLFRQRKINVIANRRLTLAPKKRNGLTSNGCFVYWWKIRRNPSEGDENSVRERTHVISLVLLMLLAVLIASGAAAEQATIPADTIMQSYRDVLLGKRDYTQCNHYDSVYRDTRFSGEFYQWYGFEFESPLRIDGFCVIDLDADGSEELVLRLSQDFGFEVLRYENGQVYGFLFVYRAMEAITTSGDIHGSNGADDYGWYQVRFAAEKMESIELCWKHADGDGRYQYRISGEEVSEMDFTAFCDGLWGKSRPSWEEYTPENVEKAL
jgi:hypothetical protein